ncbi:HET-domain-containing protein [Daldinia decipiens]|uniref:HET-domain-containing protein n=1 Tax=Daldinia decipiens TaxID=326647 RepID=UPI0020C5B37F|nr:HET-domain-containing protein [Daldinia decipiens]KAI1658835.1 HET-domain-containing protein [Daldinia decipiens]
MAQREEIPHRLVPYKYCPLSSNAHTRVLNLHPSLDPLAPIRCSLFEINLDHEKSEYDALSYTWGIPSFTEELIVDQYYLMITPNLLYALQRFRMPTVARMIWIDAICINQEDNDEKSRQIPFMRQIYRSASSVFVWLGIDESGSDSLRRLHHYTKQPGPSVSTAEITRELGNITKLPWFHRRWIIQEVVLNPNVFLNCAGVSMPWVRLVQALSTGIATEVMSSLVTMADLWKDWILRKDDAQPHMFNLLASFHGSECQDARDMIYALAGLASDVQLRDNINKKGRTKEIDGRGVEKETGDHEKTMIPVDYTITAECLYHDVVVGLLDSGNLGTVGLLAQCAIRKTADESDQMPSWVPDWRKPKIREPLWFSPHIQGHLEPHNRSILTIKSSSIYLLGKVTNNNVSAIFPSEYFESEIHEWFLDTWASLSELQVQASQHSVHQHQHQPSEHILARLVNTVLNEKTPYEHDGLTSFNMEGFHKSWAEYRGYLQRVCEDIQQGSINKEFYKYTWNYMKGRTIFIWQDAAKSQPQYGFGPSHTQPGDTILAPESSTFQAFFNTGMRPLNTNKSSLLLRKSPDEIDLPFERKDRVLPGNFRLVGDCQIMLYSGRTIHDLTKESDDYAPLSFSWFRQFSIS